MLKNKHKKHRKYCSLTLQNGQSRFRVPPAHLPPARVQSGVCLMLCSRTLSHVTPEEMQQTLSGTGAGVPARLPSSGLLPATCFPNPCFHIESNLDLHTDKSYKLPKQNKLFPSMMGHLAFIILIWEP